MQETKNHGKESPIDELRKSSMFYLSLSSKELFHSNFLYWLSVKDWDAFLCVARRLAGVDKFWWEADYCPQQHNIEVRRESRNFDLSIYVKIYEDSQANQEADLKGKNDVWIPVFVLENKVKSMPRHEQLQQYVGKAINEWKKKKSKDQIRELWQQKGISFVLLSLFLPSDVAELCQCKHQIIYASKNEKKTIKLCCSWTFKDYGQLFDILSGVNLQRANNLEKDILPDYLQFIRALDNLAKTDWTVSPDDDFVKKIYPWAQKDYHGDSQTELRIDDIRQKVHYAQLLEMLEKKLKKKGIEAKHVSEDKNFEVTVNTNYAHNIGLLEAAIHFPGSSDCRLIIQLQGNSYCHGFYNEKDAASKLSTLKGRLESFLEFNETVATTEKYPKLLKADKLYPGKVNNRLKNMANLRNFKHFGQPFIYQNVLIPTGVTVGNVIDAMIEDIQKCRELVERKKQK